jgi:hypothetical protein
MLAGVDPVVWMAESTARPLRAHLASARFIDGAGASANEFHDATRSPGTVAFVDRTTLPLVGTAAAPVGPVIAICDEPLPTAIGWLADHPWLSHAVSASMLDHPIADEHLGNVLRTFVSDKPRLLDWLGPSIVGRRVRLTRAASRATRIDKMSEFFTGHAVSARTIAQLRDAAEELLTNAFYNAPVAAGSAAPVSRTEDVELPEAAACDLAYGCRDDLAIVRVRDPFGSLTRARLVEVLTRCARTDMQVEVDETMGGAGLGMWRVFASASFVAVLMVKHHLTEILVGIAKRSAAAPKPFALHFFFQ